MATKLQSHARRSASPDAMSLVVGQGKVEALSPNRTGSAGFLSPLGNSSGISQVWEEGVRVILTRHLPSFFLRFHEFAVSRKSVSSHSFQHVASLSAALLETTTGRLQRPLSVSCRYLPRPQSEGHARESSALVALEVCELQQHAFAILSMSVLPTKVNYTTRKPLQSNKSSKSSLTRGLSLHWGKEAQ